MGHVFRWLSSPRISYISITSGSFVIYKAFCARQKRKEFESTLFVSSRAASAAALSFPFTSSAAEAPLDGALRRSYSSAASVVPDFPSESVLHISRDVWRETLVSAKAAANAAGIPERELDPRQLAAAIAAAQVFTTTQGNSCASFGTYGFGLLKKVSSNFSDFPSVQHVLTRAAKLRWPWVNDTSVTCVLEESQSIDHQTNPCEQPVEGPGGSTAAPSPTTDHTESRSKKEHSPSRHPTPTALDGSEPSDLSSASNASDILQRRQLCVGRVAAVQMVRRQLRIGRARERASQICDEGELHQCCSTRPYIQWPGRYLRVTYQYFVVIPDRRNSDMTVRTHGCRTERHDDKTHKTQPTVNKEKTENGRFRNSHASAKPESEQVGYGRRVGLSIMKQDTQYNEKGSRDSLPAWGHSWPHRLRNAFGTLRQHLFFSRSGNASTLHQADASMQESMPPLLICEMTVEFRLPSEGYTQKHRRKAVKEPLPTVSIYSDSRGSEVPHTVQATASEAPEVLGVAPERRKSTPDVRSITWIAKEIAKSQAAPSAASSVAGGSAFSDNSHKHPLAPDLNCAASGGYQPAVSADDGINICVNPVAVKPLKRVMQAWRDIQPQQLVVVSYETGKPFHSTPLVVLTQPDETTFSNRSATVGNNAREGSSAAKSETYSAMRVDTVEGSQDGRGTVLLDSKSMRNASTETVEDNNNRLDSPYSGELIELAGTTIQSDQKFFLIAGSLLTSLGVLKLCLQKLLLEQIKM